MDNTLCDSASTENSNTASVTSNPAQSEGALHGSVFVAGDFIVSDFPVAYVLHE